MHLVPIDMKVIRQSAAYILLVSIYGFTYLVALLGSLMPRRPWKPTSRIMAIGTFHNPNWYISHVSPLSCSGVEEVILIVDEPQMSMDRVRFVCPPKWISKLLSRAVAKAIWMIIAGLRYRPDLYMGYHFGAGPCSALIAGKLMERPSCCQMTGGPVTILGGGIGAIGSVGGALGRPSKFIEALAIRVIRQFELVVVRGSKAKEFVTACDIKGAVAIITGGINTRRELAPKDRDIHLIYVGRLSPIKQVDQFILIVDCVRRIMPDVGAVIVGDGPLCTDLQDYVKELELSENITFPGKTNDVERFLARSKVLILTSKSEGLSIAMAEAMAAGTVPVVADVGELGDLVVDGVNGYLIEPGNINEYAERVVSLLQDQALWNQLSQKAIEAARRHCDVELVSKRWKKHLREVISQSSGCSVQDVWS